LENAQRSVAHYPVIKRKQRHKKTNKMQKNFSFADHSIYLYDKRLVSFSLNDNLSD